MYFSENCWIMIRNRILFLFAIGLFLLTGSVRAIEVTKTICEMAVDSLCVAAKLPRFGWQMHSSEQGSMQMAYGIMIKSGSYSFTKKL